MSCRLNARTAQWYRMTPMPVPCRCEYRLVMFRVEVTRIICDHFEATASRS